MGSKGVIRKTHLVMAAAKETDNVDACLTNGWYWITENAQGCPVSGAPLFVIGGKDRIWQYVFDSQSGSEIHRYTVDGGVTWEPWSGEDSPVADEI